MLEVKDSEIPPAPPTPPIARTVKEGIFSDNVVETLKAGWNTFNKYLVCILISALIGISIGVKVSQKFYSEKMDDATLAGSFVFKGKPFTISAK